MRSAVVLDGRFRVFEDGSIFKIIDGVDRPAKISNGRYLSVYSEKKNYPVHRLIAAAFIPNPENKQYINHKDGDKHNNAVDNL